ncbi:MAG: 50S ribosomal protein L17 [Parcubacteria group bacterium]
MRHRVKTTKLKREKAPRQALLRSLVRSMVLQGKLETTLAKAKTLQPLVERLITVAKRKDRQAKRLLLKHTHSSSVTDKLIKEFAEKFASREGGYTRIRRTGNRKGDGATLAHISFVSR